MVVALAVTFIIVAALFPVLASALTDYDTAVNDTLSAALLVIVPVLISVAILYAAIRMSGFGKSK